MEGQGRGGEGRENFGAGSVLEDQSKEGRGKFSENGDFNSREEVELSSVDEGGKEWRR